jgi:NB-ARC domain
LTVPLKHGAKGSKVLITTTSSKVCQIMSLKRYRLSCLCDDECWSVCQPQLLCANLTEMGKKIAAKYKGLSLAAEAVGSVLRLSIVKKHWGKVLENYL